MSDGQKFDDNKARWDLLPVGPVAQVVAVLDYGARKYGPDTWQHVPNAKRRYYAALWRHLVAWWGGETHDSESGLHHLAHVATNALFLIWFATESERT